jgi:hypothetical protein
MNWDVRNRVQSSTRRIDIKLRVPQKNCDVTYSKKDVKHARKKVENRFKNETTIYTEISVNTLVMEKVSTSETSVSMDQITWRTVSEDCEIHCFEIPVS